MDFCLDNEKRKKNQQQQPNRTEQNSDNHAATVLFIIRNLFQINKTNVYRQILCNRRNGTKKSKIAFKFH